MNFLDLVKGETENILNTHKSNGGLLWFMTEIIQIIILVMGAIMLLWLYAPFSIIVKGALTTIATIITYDVFKNFVYVRYILWKESKEE